MVNADTNVKNRLTKEYVIIDLSGILVNVIAHVVNCAMLANI